MVAAACYVARTFGVKSAMPMFEALRLCPHARVVRPNMEKYVRVGREVRRMMCSVLAGYAWDESNPFVAEPRRRLDTLAQLCALQNRARP